MSLTRLTDEPWAPKCLLLGLGAAPRMIFFAQRSLFRAFWASWFASGFFGRASGHRKSRTDPGRPTEAWAPHFWADPPQHRPHHRRRDGALLTRPDRYLAVSSRAGPLLWILWQRPVRSASCGDRVEAAVRPTSPFPRFVRSVDRSRKKGKGDVAPCSTASTATGVHTIVRDLCSRQLGNAESSRHRMARRWRRSRALANSHMPSPSTSTDRLVKIEGGLAD